MNKVEALRGSNGTRTPPADDDVDVSNHQLFEVCSEVGHQGAKPSNVLPPYTN